ncbi:MAG: selenocysteine-specific translation elongation factor [Pseudomonadales bacterium]|nr:selenocysteine-specific translation elongation factor [Pseudomonadales bacterium]
MIVTLAGHVDHGKTSLVNALTGVNTDRLAEEQARSLTIDLGFAYIDNGNIGFVDVPGHQKFIHNMVAGVAADQFALLVIAADDGPMPQSKEHLEILSLVGVKRGLVVMTKCDRVPPERLDVCEQEIQNLVSSSFLEGANVYRTTIEQPNSFKALLEALRAVETSERTDSADEPFRLAIDRSFIVKGSGVVVTGTAHSGAIANGTELFHFPSGERVRVRGLRIQNQETEIAQRGDRSAINISGLDLESIGRGDWLTSVPPRQHREITVELSVLNDFPRSIKQWTPVHIYHATSHTTGHVALHTGSRMAPGSSRLVDLICDDPLPVCHSDHLVIRDHGLDTTLGGGRVVFAQEEITQRRRTPVRLAALAAYNQPDPSQCCNALLSNQAFTIRDFRDLWQLTEGQTQKILSQHAAMELAGFAIGKSALGEYAKNIVDRITKHLDANPSSRGLKVDAFKDIPKPLLDQVLSALVQANRLRVLNGVYGLPSHQAALPEALQSLWSRAEKSLDDIQPPSSGDLAKAWQQPQPEVQKALKELAKRGYLVQIADHRFYTPEVLNQVARRVAELAQTGSFTVREFRDRTGIGRNVAIDILEYFDSRGFTRREENHRKLLRDHL